MEARGGFYANRIAPIPTGNQLGRVAFNGLNLLAGDIE